LDETNSEVQLALAESALRRQQWDELRRRMASLGDVASTQRRLLERDAALTQGWRLAAGHHWRSEPGSAGVPPGESRSTTTRLDAPLWSNGWRPFVTAEHIQGTAPGVYDATRRRTGLGLQYAGPDDEAELVAIEETGIRPGPSLSVSARHAFNDQWVLSGGMAKRSADAPLRASANGIDVNTSNLGVDYHQDETLAVSLGWQDYKFSDGNQRYSGLAMLTHQLFASSVWRLSMREAVYFSRNSSNAGPYFSPLRDRTVPISLISERVWLRTPHISWTDRLELQAGNYRQIGYASKTVTTVSYEQTYRPSAAWEWSGGLAYNLRYYDGTPQRSTSGHVRLVTRF
jgi:hypothetical protein